VVNDGVRHHVALTYDGTTYRLYIDGVADGTLASATAPKTTTSDPMGIGYRSGASNEFFNGVIDEVAVYNTALSAARIAAHSAAAAGAAARGTSDSAPAVDTVAKSGSILTRATADSAPAVDVASHAHFQAVSVADSAPAVATVARVAVRSRATADLAHAIDSLVVSVSHSIPAETGDLSQTWGFNLGVGIELDPIDPAVAPGSRIHIRAESYDPPVLVDGRPT
jgi:hypothetical protein